MQITDQEYSQIYLILESYAAAYKSRKISEVMKIHQQIAVNPKALYLLMTLPECSDLYFAYGKVHTFFVEQTKQFYKKYPKFIRPEVH